MILRPKNQTIFFGRRIKRHTNASETTDKTVATDAKRPEPRNRGTKPGRRAPRKRSTKPHATKDASHSANRADESKLPGNNPCNGQPAGHPATTARDQPPAVAPAQKPQRAPYARDLPSQQACKARKGGSTEHERQTLQNSDVSQQQPAVRINARTTGSRKYPTATGQPQPEYNTGQGPKCASGGTSASTTGRGGSTGSHSPALPALACFRAAASV